MYLVFMVTEIWRENGQPQLVSRISSIQQYYVRGFHQQVTTQNDSFQELHLFR